MGGGAGAGMCEENITVNISISMETKEVGVASATERSLLTLTWNKEVFKDVQKKLFL